MRFALRWSVFAALVLGTAAGRPPSVDAKERGGGPPGVQPPERGQETEPEEEGGEETPAEEPGPLRFAEEVVVVGSRARPRSAVESTVPIDAISGREVASLADADLGDRLRTLVPSFHVNTQPISDAATIVRPVNLRGLAPDHTLVLVNGKRRHRSAVINWLGNGAADGAQGPDVSVIPAIALRQVEVLRDGAAAQYGSDAIAGVLNFLLKDDASGGSLEFRSGAFQDGNPGDPGSYADAGGHGVGYQLAGNVGLPLGRTGFANLSFEYGASEPTNRAVQRADAQAIRDAGNPHVRDPAQVWGSPRIEDDLKLFGNFGHLFGGGIQWYGHANYATRTVDGGFYFRNPNTRGGIYSADGGATLLVADVLAASGAGSANCPTVAITNHVPDPEALARVAADPNCFTFHEIFPGGFTPQFGGDATDAAVVTGVRGFRASGLTWDVSANLAAHEVDLFIRDTVNASLGPDSPTEFRPGSNRQEETSLNLDLTYPAGDALNLAAGAEWREEVFTTGLGQTESWLVGPYGAQGFASTSNGFPGYGPLAAGSWSRWSVAGYGDVEVDDPEDAWTLGAAFRIENFQDFGVTTTGKLSGRYRLAEALALRASAGTGFRAPTPGQANVFNLSSEFSQAANDFVINGTIPPTSRVAELKGGRLLQPERSRNLTLGAVLTAGEFTLTADWFRIALRDRLGISQNFSLSPAEVEGLLAEGVESARDLESFRFFVNAFETRTQGLDVVSTWTPSGPDGRTTIRVVFNHTATRVTGFEPATLDGVRIREIEEAVPKTRWNAAVTHELGPLRLLGRLHFYGGWWDTEDVLFYDGKHLLDLEASAPVGGGATLAVGGRNILNTYPDEHPFAALRLGNRYSQFTPFGFNGAYYYTRVVYTWNR